VELRASLNNGLSGVLAENFPNVKPVERPKVELTGRIYRRFKKITSIVVFGTNLTSTVGIKFTRKQLAMVKLAPSPKGVIIGLLLSNGWLIFSSKASKNARLGFSQSAVHSKYF